MQAEEIIKALNWRYAVRAFDTTKKVSDDDMHTILEAARLAPSVQGIEAWKFIVVENEDVRAKLREAGFGQPKFTEASHLVIIARRTDVVENIIDERIERTARIQGVSEESLDGLRQMLVGGIGSKAADQTALDGWIAGQTYIALGMMVETAALLGVDAGPMEGFVNHQVDEILGLPSKHLASVTAIAFGYRMEDDKFAKMPKVRREFDEVVEFVR
jgi:nitroreductase/dihydropteridine reductase